MKKAPLPLRSALCTKRRPSALQAPGRVDELQAVEVRVGRRRRQLADHLAGVGVGEEEVDREEVALREEDEPFAVGRERRAEVQLPAPAFLARSAADRSRQASCSPSGSPRRSARTASPHSFEKVFSSCPRSLSTAAIGSPERLASRKSATALSSPQRPATYAQKRVTEAVGEERRVAELLQRRQLVRRAPRRAATSPSADPRVRARGTRPGPRRTTAAGGRSCW